MNAAVLEAKEPSASFVALTDVARGVELIATASSGVAKLRELILELAVLGKLVPQQVGEEPAIRLVVRAQAQKGAHAAEANAPVAHADDSRSLPRGWCWSSLGEIGLINPRNVADDDTPASFVQMSSVPVAMMEPHATETRAWRDIKSGFTHFAERDVGLAKITPCFENAKSTVFRNLTSGIGAGTTELYVVRPLAGVLPEYLLAFLKSPRFLRSGESVMTGSAGQKRLPRAYFESAALPLPPLAEQHRIVARVAELTKLCDALEAKGRLADEQHARLASTLFDALTASESAHAMAENWRRIAEHFDLLLDRPDAIDVLERTIDQLALRGLLVQQDGTDEGAAHSLEAMSAEIANYRNQHRIPLSRIEPVVAAGCPFPPPVGWLWVRLDSMFRVITDGDHLPPPKSERGVAFLTIGNISAGRLDFDNCRCVPQEYFDGLAEYRRPRSGDILYTVVGATYGRPVVVDSDRPFCVQRHIAVLKPANRGVHVGYLHLLLRAPLTYEQATNGITGTAQPTIPLGALRNYLAPLPPLAEQHRIAARVEELRSLCAQLRKRLTLARDAQVCLAGAVVAQAVA